MKLKYLASITIGISALSLTACGGDKAETKAKSSGEPSRPECIAPAKPGGGFDLTCKLAQSGLQETGLLSQPMRVSYMPGGIGAVAYNKVVSNGRTDENAIVAFSTGSILNLSQGKFGKYTEKDVKWLAAVGTDYGALAVSADSPLKSLKDLAEKMKTDPKSISVGSGGSVGSQDWMQTAMFAKAAGVDPNAMSYVAMEGGGEAITAALGGHISVVSAGIAEFMPQVTAGKMRILGVFSKERLPDSMADIPTAKEQGYDVEWPVIRGYYMGPDVSESSYNWWKKNMDTMLADPKFTELRKQRELLPFALTGAELEQYVLKTTEEMRTLSKEYNLIQSPDK